tara:strand:- start:682 stop:1092 length:411 start_codon:yes stop_codon:yes gene_type:complete
MYVIKTKRRRESTNLTKWYDSSARPIRVACGVGYIHDYVSIFGEQQFDVFVAARVGLVFHHAALADEFGHVRLDGDGVLGASEIRSGIRAETEGSNVFRKHRVAGIQRAKHGRVQAHDFVNLVDGAQGVARAFFVI